MHKISGSGAAFRPSCSIFTSSGVGSHHGPLKLFTRARSGVAPRKSDNARSLDRPPWTSSYPHTASRGSASREEEEDDDGHLYSDVRRWQKKSREASTAESLRELELRNAPSPSIFTTEALLGFLAEQVRSWSQHQHIPERLRSFGIPHKHVPLLLRRFVTAIKGRDVLNILSYSPAEIERLAYDLSAKEYLGQLDEHLSRLFFEWAAHPAQEAELEQLTSQSTVSGIQRLFAAATLSNHADTFVWTRMAPPRKVIMHVGPTNSGKTYNALRALAAADTGMYAGPLRLLAREIFDRLNSGQIVPRGQDPNPEDEVDENTNLEDGKGAAVQKKGREEWKKPCNLLTGEEQRVVENAQLTSCTVEMIERGLKRLDVIVIDEIQLIADTDRGNAWTDAVLGANADELHLCGEERAVPLIYNLLKDTGDELVVNRYERLTPLQVADSSLGGTLKTVRKGDCIVAFSRTAIFEIKQRVEHDTGMKCAVVYGALPPEIRNEQAAMFNEVGSGADIIVGSDAIGMGLNL